MRNDTIVECDLRDLFIWEQITKGIWLIYINQLIEMLLQLQQIRLVIHHYISHRFYHSFVMHE